LLARQRAEVGDQILPTFLFPGWEQAMCV
jgi:hypothetical protein